MKSISYKGYIITPAPKQMDQTGEWSISVQIKKHYESESLVCPYSAGKTRPTRREAENFSYKFGIDIINGKVPGCSVAVLQ